MPTSKVKVGIIGGGQLARFLALEAIKLGFEPLFWAEPASSAPIEGLGKLVDSGKGDLSDFCQHIDTVVIDYEHIPLHEIEIFERFTPYQSHATLLRAAQDRLLEKNLLVELDIPTSPFFSLNSEDDIKHAKDALGFPFVIKQRRAGYDGKGQYIIKSEADLAAFNNDFKAEQYIAEKFIPFDKEYSLVSVSGVNEFKSYDLSENIHEEGILVNTKNVKDHRLSASAEQFNQRLANHTDYLGTFAVEYFAYEGKLMVNELSPRVHNTGHWTLDAAITSQFENHIRACLKLPLGSTESHSQAEMINLIGTKDAVLHYLKEDNIKFYDYCKTERPKRKLGHITRVAQFNKS